MGIIGGFVAGVYGGFTSATDYAIGIQDSFEPFHLVYAFLKTFVFAFIIATVPSWQGYYMKGGALEVGKASTNSFVWTSVLIILSNYVVTQLLLS
ncbi:MAG: phospholipid/cholesterol/gamma-HCH transport system permease protein [Patiriisocius sp.]